MSGLPRCGHCGANLSLDDLRGTLCPYCQTALPHHARAAEHAVLVNKVLEQQMGKYGYGMPPGGMPPIQYGAPPPAGYNPYAGMHQDIGKSIRRSVLISIVIGVVAMGVMVGVGLVVFVMLL